MGWGLEFVGPDRTRPLRNLVTRAGSTAMVENSFFSKSSHVMYTKLLYT